MKRNKPYAHLFLDCKDIGGTSKGPVINYSWGEDGRHLGGGSKILPTQREGG